MYKYTFLILPFCIGFLLNCKSTEEFTGFSYDPPNVTDTQDKKVQLNTEELLEPEPQRSGYLIILKVPV